MQRETTPHIQQQTVAAALPSLPDTLLCSLEVCARDNAPLPEVAYAIRLDVALATRLMDAAFGSAAKRLRFPPFALLLETLGHDAVKTLVVSAAVQQVFQPPNSAQLEELQQFHRHSLRCAFFAEAIAEKAAYPVPDEAYFTGLLHDLGKLSLMATRTAEYRQITNLAGSDAELLVLEQERLGFTNVQEAVRLLRRWSVNSFMADAVHYQHDPITRVATAHALVKILHLGHAMVEARDVTSAAMVEHGQMFFGFKAQDLADIEHTAQAQLREAMQFLDLPSGVTDITDTAQAAVAQTHKTTRLANAVRDLTVLATLSSSTSGYHDAALLNKTLRQYLQIELGYSHAIFFAHDVAHKCLRGSAGVDQPDMINEIVIPLDSASSLIKHSVKLNRPLHTFGIGDAAGQSILDEQIARLLNHDGFVVLPLVSRGEMLGAFAIGLSENELRQLDANMRRMTLFANEAAAALHFSLKQAGVQAYASPGQAAFAHSRVRKVLHEVNNPLGIIKNYIKILRLKMPKADPSQFGLEVINEEIDRVVSIVRSLAEPGPEVAQTIDDVNVNHVIIDLMQITHEQLFSGDKIRLRTELDHSIRAVACDRNQLKQVLINLMKNAAEAMASQGGDMAVITKDDVAETGQHRVMISVQDNGPGIPEAVLARLFRPVTSTKGDGHAGLGLSIVHELVTGMGGQIKVTSDVHSGTRFDILLPGEAR
jgi:nitrogen-specific signal transduction histidine kinase/HD-like signal output (HDOD) protein